VSKNNMSLGGEKKRKRASCVPSGDEQTQKFLRRQGKDKAISQKPASGGRVGRRTRKSMVFQSGKGEKKGRKVLVRKGRYQAMGGLGVSETKAYPKLGGGKGGQITNTLHIFQCQVERGAGGGTNHL